MRDIPTHPTHLPYHVNLWPNKLYLNTQTYENVKISIYHLPLLQILCIRTRINWRYHSVVEIGKHHHSQGYHSSKIYEATLGLIELSTFPSTFNKWYFKQLLQMLIKLESHSRQSSLPNLTCVTQAKESDSLILASSTEAFGRDRQ